MQGAKGKVPAYKRYKHLLRNDGVVPQTLDDDLKAELPLKRVWMVAAQDAE